MSNVRTITSVANINKGNAVDDKVAAVANSMNVSTQEAERLVERYEKQQAYRKQYAQKRYQQMKQVRAALANSK